MPRFNCSASYINYSRYAGPRTYTAIVRHGSRNISVVIPTGERVLVPREIFYREWRPQSEQDRIQEMTADLTVHQNLESSAQVYAQNRLFHNNGLSGMTFGLEFEFVGDSRQRIEFDRKMIELVGSSRYNDTYTHYHYQDNGFERWLLTNDSSIQHWDPAISRRHGHGNPDSDEVYSRGFELVTPIMHFSENDFCEIESVLKLVREVFRGYCTVHCGTHCHIGKFGGDILIGTQFDWGSVSTKRRVYEIGWAYGEFEMDLFRKLVPPSRHNAHYTGTCINTRGNFYSESYRYNHVNLHQFPATGAVEFRQHSSTLNAKKILAWAELVACFAKMAYQSPAQLQLLRGKSLDTILIGLRVSTQTQETLKARVAELEEAEERRQRRARRAV